MLNKNHRHREQDRLVGTFIDWHALSFAGLRDYVAPEVVRTKKLHQSSTYECDQWIVTLNEMFCRRLSLD